MINNSRYESIRHLLSGKYSVYLVGTLLIIAALVRIAALVNYDNSLYGSYLIYDERVYHNWARSIANGTADSMSVHDFAPLPAYMFAFVYKLFSPNPFYIRCINIFFGVLTCLMVYLSGKELAGYQEGLCACLIACFYKPFIFFSVVIEKTSLGIFLFAVAIYLLLILLNLKQAKKSVVVPIGLLGVFLGLLINVRSNCIVLAPILPLFVLWYFLNNHFRVKVVVLAMFSYGLGLTVAMAPFVVGNYQDTGELTITPLGGFNLYLANNLENPYPYYRPVTFASSVPSKQAKQFIIEASRRAGEKLSPRQASVFWIDEVVSNTVEHPWAIGAKLAQKILAFCNKYESADNHHIGFISDYVKIFKLPFFSFWMIFPLGMAGMAMALMKCHKSRVLCGVLLLYGFTLVVFFTNIRIRLPVLILLIPLAVAGVGSFIDYVKNREIKKIIFYCCLALFFLAIEFLPVPGTDDLTAHYNTHAIVLMKKGKRQSAMKFLQTSSQMEKPYSAFANHSLAKIYFNKKNIHKALHYLQKIPDTSFAAASKYALKGDIAIRQGDSGKATTAYKKALLVNSGRNDVRRKLLKIYRKTDRSKARQEYEKLRYIASF